MSESALRIQSVTFEEVPTPLSRELTPYLYAPENQLVKRKVGSEQTTTYMYLRHARSMTQHIKAREAHTRAYWNFGFRIVTKIALFGKTKDPSGAGGRYLTHPIFGDTLDVSNPPDRLQQVGRPITLVALWSHHGTV